MTAFKVFLINKYIVPSHPWSRSNLEEAMGCQQSHLGFSGTLRKTTCFMILDFGRGHRHIPGVCHDFIVITMLFSFRLSSGHLSQRCSSIPQVGENQAGEKKVANLSGGQKTSHGPMSAVMSAQKNKNRG